MFDKILLILSFIFIALCMVAGGAFHSIRKDKCRQVCQYAERDHQRPSDKNFKFEFGYHELSKCYCIDKNGEYKLRIIWEFFEL